MSDLRSALEDAFSKVEQAEAPVVEATETVQEAQEPAQTEQAPEDTGRDEMGRFKAKEKTQEATEKPQEQAQTAPPVTTPVRNPFSSWKPDAQTALMKAERGEALTPEELKLVRIEAERRESDFHRGVSEFKSHSERARQYDAVIAPYQQHLQKLGVDAPTAINALMKADVTLRTSDPATKAQYFAQLAREYGIDLGQVQNPPQVDPQTQFLMNQINELRQSQQLWQNQIQQQEQQEAQKLLSQFATADRPHFNALRDDMAFLLETKKASSLDEAYDMAAWMRQDIRTTLIDQQRTEAQRLATEQAQIRKAQTANVSVKGSGPVNVGNQSVKGSLRDIIAASLSDD